jgi:hypothetical protein
MIRGVNSTSSHEAAAAAGDICLISRWVNATRTGSFLTTGERERETSKSLLTHSNSIGRWRSQLEKDGKRPNAKLIKR